MTLNHIRLVNLNRGERNLIKGETTRELKAVMKKKWGEKVQRRVSRGKMMAKTLPFGPGSPSPIDNNKINKLN